MEVNIVVLKIISFKFFLYYVPIRVGSSKWRDHVVTIFSYQNSEITQRLFNSVPQAYPEVISEHASVVVDD